jgi:hypothetical protein
MVTKVAIISQRQVRFFSLIFVITLLFEIRVDTEEASMSDMPRHLCYIIVITKIQFVYFRRGKY